MKKQNPTNKLAFNKVAVAELNDTQLREVNGGTLMSIHSMMLVTMTLIQID
ncbi:class I lanthipeptide [Flavobacterium sp. FlaQc-52]|jgi:hypothetical protein|uniref:class I lanthipeptide n=1 Tax=Flavobacterium sp. FlaQc-52 TaxID=3374185 RepID=UPI0037568F94